MTDAHPPLPPFTLETAIQKVQAAEDGLMSRREASINDIAIDESQRRYFGPRPPAEHGQDLPLW